MPSTALCHWKIQTEQANQVNLELFNLLGQSQIQQNSPTRSQLHEGTIDLSTLEAGTYLLKIKVGEKTAIRKIVKY